MIFVENSGNKDFSLGDDPNVKSYPYNNRVGNKKSSFGFRISILSLRNYPLKKPIKVKLILYE